MRVAIAGKGGAGKTTLSATLARLAARAGASVVAIDADSNPNLATALGMRHAETIAARPLPASIVSRKLSGPALNEPVEDVLDRYMLEAPDGVRVGLMGAPAHAEEGCLCSAHATVSALLGELGMRPEILTIVDMEASPEHLGRGTARHADQLLLVTEPYYRSLETVRRLAALADELPIARVGVIANKVRSDEHGHAVAEFCERHGLELIATVPWSDEVIDADIAGEPLIERGDGQVVAVLRELLRERLRVQLPTPGRTVAPVGAERRYQ